MNRGQTVRTSNRGLESPWLDYKKLEQKKIQGKTEKYMNKWFFGSWMADQVEVILSTSTHGNKVPMAKW